MTTITSELIPTVTTEAMGISADAYSPSILTQDIDKKCKDLWSRRAKIDQLCEQFKEKEQHFCSTLGPKKLSELVTNNEQPTTSNRYLQLPTDVTAFML